MKHNTNNENENETITLQQVLDQNHEWFVIEKHPRSVSEGQWTTVCAYRGDNGAQCAIGCVIPDRLYKSSMDDEESSSSIEGVLANFPNVRAFFGDIPMAKLGKLQTIHDNYMGGQFGMFDAYMDDKLREFASENNLNYPEKAG